MNKLPKLQFQVKIEGEKHQVEKALEEAKDLPVLVGIGFARVPGQNTYFSYVIKTKGDKVISISEISDGMHVSGAFDSTKINAIDYLLHPAQNQISEGE